MNDPNKVVRLQRKTPIMTTELELKIGLVFDNHYIHSVVIKFMLRVCEEATNQMP